MLAKKLKLSAEEFPQRGTLCFKGERLSLKKASNKRGYSRLGVVVSKKVSAKATVRNWVKRVVYDFMRIHWVDIPKGVDLLVAVSGHIIETSPDTKKALCDELEKGLKAL